MVEQSGSMEGSQDNVVMTSQDKEEGYEETPHQVVSLYKSIKEAEWSWQTAEFFHSNRSEKHKIVAYG